MAIASWTLLATAGVRAATVTLVGMPWATSVANDGPERTARLALSAGVSSAANT